MTTPVIAKSQRVGAKRRPMTGSATKQSILRNSGMVRRTRPQMCNCTSGNLEIPGSRRSLSSGAHSRDPLARPGMTGADLFRRRHDINLPADRRTGVAVEEALRGDRKLLGVLAILPHPGLADRQPPIGGIADADEPEPPGLLKRGQPPRPELARREW